MTTNLYGQTRSEKVAKENELVRQMMREISNLGINDRQRLFLMYLLSLELENFDEVKLFSSFIKENAGDKIFIVPKDELKDDEVE